MQIRLVSTKEDRELVFRLRYEIYVGGMGRTQKCADHSARKIEEPLDDKAHLFGAFEDRLIGTVRTNLARDGSLGYYDDLYNTKCVGRAYPSGVSITTKLMVEPEHRGGRAGLYLAMAVYRHNIELGIEFDFIDCNDHLIPFFTGLGYRMYREPIVHPEFGRVTPMLLRTGDLKHFEAMRSPFAGILRTVTRERSRSSAMEAM